MADGVTAQKPEWDSSVHTRSGVDCHPTVVDVPLGIDGQPACDLRQDEVDETQKHWIQELECERVENQQQCHLDKQRMYRSDILSRESPRPGKGSEPEGESSDSDTQSPAQSPGRRSCAEAIKSDNNERQHRAQDYKRAIEAQIDEKQQRLRAEREADDRQDRKQERYMDEDRQKMKQQCQREQLEQSGRRHFSSESQDGNPWEGPGGGAPSCQPAESSPVHADARPLCDLREDEKEETQKDWIEELDCQRGENKQQGHKDQQRMLRSDGFSRANDESPRAERVAKPEEDFSDSELSLAQGQGDEPGTNSQLSDDQERRQRSMDYQRAIQAQVHEKEQRQRADQEAEVREDQERGRCVEEDWCKRDQLQEEFRDRYKLGN